MAKPAEIYLPRKSSPHGPRNSGGEWPKEHCGSHVRPRPYSVAKSALRIKPPSPILMNMGDGHRYETEWEGLRIVIEERPEYWQAFLYDPGPCEVLYTADRMNIDAAKLAAVEFAATARFGPSHDLKSEI